MNTLFAWRYFKSKKSTNVINIITGISVIAIAVGTAALILVLSVFNGFEGLVKSMYRDFYPDIFVSAQKGKYITLDAAQIKRLYAIKDIAYLSLTIDDKALLVNGDYPSTVNIRGVDSNYRKVVAISNHILDNGHYDLGTKTNPEIVLGGGIANAIGADLTDSVPLTVFLPNRSTANFGDLQNAMNSYNIHESGVFKIQEDFDNSYAFTNIDFIRYMVEIPDSQYSGIALKLRQSVDVERAQRRVQNLLGNRYLVQTRYQQNQSLFGVMQMEKWIIYIILFVILVIAAFNMVGALTMLILEKRRDIAVLKALGASNKLIRRIFLSEGFLLAGIGGFSGMAVAFIICVLQQKYHLLKLEGGSFVVDYYPVVMHINDFILVGFTIFVVALAASWIPARKAAIKHFPLKSGD